MKRTHDLAVDVDSEGGVGNVTADLTTTKGPSGTQYRYPKHKNKSKLQLHQLVNKEKHFTDSKFEGSKRL